MRPWLLVSGDFTRLGGMDRANHALASFLARRGDPVHLVTHRAADDLAAFTNVTVHHVPRPAGWHLAGMPLLASYAGRVAGTLGEDARVLANGGNLRFTAPSWIHYLHAAFTPVPARSLRSRAVAAVSSAYFVRQERHAVAQAPLVICNSHRTARDVQHHYGLPPSKTPVVYYGTDDEFAPVSDAERAASRASLGIARTARIALFVGALGDRRKGFDLLFDAWRRLSADRAWDVDLLVIGAGADRDGWQAAAAAADVGSRLRFLGFRDDVASVLAAADLVVHPARYEAYGLGVHEALCRGVPAIVTTTAGVAERYAPELQALLLADPPCVDGLVETLRAWREDADGWRARVATASPALRARRWDDMAADIAARLEAR